MRFLVWVLHPLGSRVRLQQATCSWSMSLPRVTLPPHPFSNSLCPYLLCESLGSLLGLQRAGMEKPSANTLQVPATVNQHLS